ncbi:MAG: polysaccharide deacetylase family protein [Propionibacteriaceae bacterium]|nr:polysaccharide deacetylase family protein [Propionibacteriaceae bacterium]
MVGESVSRWPDVVRRAVAEGHTIGSHTFYHTDDTEVVDSRFTLELDATQRAMRAVSHAHNLCSAALRGFPPQRPTCSTPSGAADIDSETMRTPACPPSWNRPEQPGRHRPKSVVHEVVLRRWPRWSN